MENEDPLLYEKLKANIIKHSPKRTMYLVEEDSDESVETKNNTFFKMKLIRRASNFSG